MVGDVCPAVATARQQEARGIRTQHGTAPIVTSSPVIVASAMVAGLSAYPETDIGELRKMANETTMPGASQGDRIRLRPVGTTWMSDEPDMPGNLDGTTFRAFDKACARAPGKKPAVSLLPRNPRVSRRCGAWVSIARLP